MKVGVLDYGIGNVKSVYRLCKKFSSVQIVGPQDPWEDYNLIILPGVGSFDHAVQLTNASNLQAQLPLHLSKGGFILGICVGMQVLLESSEEGVLPGLALVEGCLKKLTSSPGYPVPHMGWSEVSTTDFPFFVEGEFYFTHSYALSKETFDADGYQTLKSTYHDDIFAGFFRDNIFGVQFHPEKSGTNGRDFLENIINYVDGSAL